ncbi:MAG: flagellar hook-associated protein FlgK [Lutisporaceae bacterium]
MRSSFAGLSIGWSAIMAQQRAIDITGHNISNVNTPGYSRQTVINTSTSPTYVGVSGNGRVMSVGTGVDVQEIRQYKDFFLDQKIRRENKDLGYWEARKGSVEELETIFNDNSEEGLQTVMDNFWNSWSELSKPGGGLTARSLVKENAIAFVETVKNLDNLLINYRKHRNSEIGENIDTLNGITKNIANLNYEIKKIEGGGVTANDLRSERDNYIDQLSKMANIQVVDGDKMNIALEGMLLVSDTNQIPLVAVPDIGADGFYSIKWAKTMEDIHIRGGSIKALIESRDELVSGYKNKLNEFVKGVATEVNTIHKAGYGNLDPLLQTSMFVNSKDNTDLGIDIGNIGYNPILVEVNNIAAAISPPPGNFEDNRNALKISEWRQQDVFSDETYVGVDGKYNFDEFYRNLITDIGLEGNKAANAAEAQDLLIEQLEFKRQSLMAVSLDEEMSNLIRFEHSYNAAARIVNALDEMLDLIVNRLGK